MATDGHGKYTVRVLTICILPSHPLGKVEGAYHHHGLASYSCAWSSCTLELYILQNISHVIICKFSLRISKNYTQNVTEPLTHAQTVRSSLIFLICPCIAAGEFWWNPPWPCSQALEKRNTPQYYCTYTQCVYLNIVV